jgi:hypothetical protein
MYWGLFTQPQFIATYLEMDPDSKEFLSCIKDHAREMTMRMAGARAASLSSPSQQKKEKSAKGAPKLEKKM